jgi:hypothetical protein
MADTWFDSFVEEENSSREAVRTAVLLAKTRYDEQLKDFVGGSEERLGFVHGEVDRIADECAAMTGAARPDVFQKLMKVIEADVIIPVTEPEREDLTSGDGGSAPPERNAESAPEPTATTDVLDHDTVAEDAILHPDNAKMIPVQDGALVADADNPDPSDNAKMKDASFKDLPGIAKLAMDSHEFIQLAEAYSNLGWAVQDQLKDVLEGGSLEDQNPNALKMALSFAQQAHQSGVHDFDWLIEEIDQYLSHNNANSYESCVRCTTRTASEGSPVCEACNTELVALAADDSPPLESSGDQSVNQQFLEGDRIVFTKADWQGITGTVAEKREAPQGACYVIELDEAKNGYTRTPCFYPGAFARAQGDKAGEDLGLDVQSKQADVAPAQPSPVMNQGQQAPQQQAGPGVAQPLNPNAPYQCVVCGFTGTFQAVQDHLATAQDTEHMRAKQNPGGQQAPATAPPGQQTAQPQQPTQAKVADAPDPNDPPAQPGGDTDPHDEEPVKADDPQENLSPSSKFQDIVSSMANRAAAKAFSVPADEEIQAIAEQYGLDPHQVRERLVAKATFGDFSAINGKVGATDVPQGYQKIQVQGLGGVVQQHQAIVPTASAVRKVSEDLGIDENTVYESIKESMGDNLGDQYHATVDGDHTFYLPAELAANGPQPDDTQQQQPPQQQMPPQPQQAMPQQQIPQQMPQAPTSSLLAKDLRIQAERLARRAQQIESQGVEGREEI